ncbi:MAG: FTR1 family iron permease [Gemmatimonadetes bacterium]|nr:FTR1 family iron permease [Gemmatimonadota bacterium]
MARLVVAVPVLVLACDQERGGSGGEGRAGKAGGQEVVADAVPGLPPGGLADWVTEIRQGFQGVLVRVGVQDLESARERALSLYITRQEYIELFYGPGGRLLSPGDEALPAAVKDSEARFHELLQLLNASPAPNSAQAAAAVSAVEAEYRRVLREAERAGVPLSPRGQAFGGTSALAGSETPPRPMVRVGRSGREPVTPAIRAMLERLGAAGRAYRAGDAPAALAQVEEAYLEGFEPLEPRLPAASVIRVERLIHLSLRPQMARSAPLEAVQETLDTLRAELLAADARLADGAGFLFGALNSFAIIVREGLEAVLLIAAILAYLSRVDGEGWHRRRIYAGVALGVAASAVTWVVARTLVPIGGGRRELIEGVTALVAVGVLIYVSNWLFQRTYIDGWKEYLKGQVGRAVSTGSAFALAGLAFAAVYREGFETVLFYQALLFDAGPGAVLSGFVPGLALIGGAGVAIIRIGVRLPLRTLFGVTNALLLYLAFVFLGKGLYSLQEGGVFAPHALTWAPDHEVLRQLLGLYPVAETLLAQGAFLLVLAGTYRFYRFYRRRERALARGRGRGRASGAQGLEAVPSRDGRRTRPGEESIVAPGAVKPVEGRASSAAGS